MLAAAEREGQWPRTLSDGRHRGRGIYDLEKLTGGQQKSFEGVTHGSNAASDQSAVCAEFEV